MHIRRLTAHRHELNKVCLRVKFSLFSIGCSRNVPVMSSNVSGKTLPVPDEGSRSAPSQSVCVRAM